MCQRAHGNGRLKYPGYFNQTSVTVVTAFIEGNTCYAGTYCTVVLATWQHPFHCLFDNRASLRRRKPGSASPS
jgi:hypothetical protein